jgi:hypothetical protein
MAQSEAGFECPARGPKPLQSGYLEVWVHSDWVIFLQPDRWPQRGNPPGPSVALKTSEVLILVLQVEPDELGLFLEG